jgi:hypothetical protein
VYLALLAYSNAPGAELPAEARRSYTDRVGTVLFTEVPRGVYALTVAAEPFPPEVRGVRLREGCRVRVEVELSIPEVPPEDLIR